MDERIGRKNKIVNDGRKLALDQRLINPDLPDDPDSKVNICVQKVIEVYESTKEQHATQMIFCDQSTPSKNFNVYDREKLIKAGVKAEEIAFIQSTKNEKEKDALFEKVRKGEVRISTVMMGTGTNVQDKLIALHDLEQRAGRIIRQGNDDVKLERLKMAKSEFLKAHEQLEHKVNKTYPDRIREIETVLAKINRDIEVVQENTVIGEDGQEKFSMILNSKTFNDKKDATAHIAEMLKKNRNSLFPLKDLSGEYKGLHISTNFNHDLGREELILEGSYSTRKNATAVAGDNINRIIDMASGRTKLAEDRQKEIDTLHDKIKDSVEELSKPI